MIVIRDAQRRVLAEVPRRRFLRSILDATRARWPDLDAAGRGDAALLDLLDGSLARAPGLAIVLEGDLRRYGALTLRLGRDPAQEPALARIAADPSSFGTPKVAALERAAGLEG